MLFPGNINFHSSTQTWSYILHSQCSSLCRHGDSEAEVSASHKRREARHKINAEQQSPRHSGCFFLSFLRPATAGDGARRRRHPSHLGPCAVLRWAPLQQETAGSADINTSAKAGDPFPINNLSLFCIFVCCWGFFSPKKTVLITETLYAAPGLPSGACDAG